jgi:hypothetical protein
MNGALPPNPSDRLLTSPWRNALSLRSRRNRAHDECGFPNIHFTFLIQSSGTARPQAS